MSNDMVKREDAAISAAEIQIISTVVQQMMAPVMENIGAILERNSAAMERIAATQQMMSTRISDLEKQVRLKTPMSKAQEKCINESIRARARELLDAKSVADDRKAVTKLGGIIRKSVLARYGVDSLREAPAYDYETALGLVTGWNNPLITRDVAKEAKHRAELVMVEAEQSAGVDGAAPLEQNSDQSGESILRNSFGGKQP